MGKSTTIAEIRELPCLACGTRINVCAHHIKTRGSGGSDEKTNLMSLCFQHHTEIHKIGTNMFSIKYRQVGSYLLQNGWEFNGRKWIAPESARKNSRH